MAPSWGKKSISSLLHSLQPPEFHRNPLHHLLISRAFLSFLSISSTCCPDFTVSSLSVSWPRTSYPSVASPFCYLPENSLFLRLQFLSYHILLTPEPTAAPSLPPHLQAQKPPHHLLGEMSTIPPSQSIPQDPRISPLTPQCSPESPCWPGTLHPPQPVPPGEEIEGEEVGKWPGEWKVSETRVLGNKTGEGKTYCEHRREGETGGGE